MMWLNRLKTIVAVLVLAGVAATAAGWLCRARALEPAAVRSDALVPGRGDVRGAGPVEAPAARAEPGEEATFAVVAVDGKRKAVALVVAGTKGPVLSLPLKENAAVFAGGQPVGPDRLQIGTRVCLRMDRAHRSIEEVRVLEEPRGARVPPAPDAGLPRPPSEEEVFRALPRVTRGVPCVYEESRDDIQVVSELIKDTIDPPRFFPLVGPARLRHCHWKCTVYYTETVESGYPFPFRCKKPRVEVVYIDRDQLILAR